MDKTELAREYHSTVTELNKLNKKKEELRKQIVDLSEEEDFTETRQVTIPKSFFETVEMTIFDFVMTRYPSWNILSVNETDDEYSYIMERKKKYVPWNLVVGDITITKSVSDSIPKIDWETLEKEDPVLMKQISIVNKQRVLDDNKLTKTIDRNPEAFSVLERHLIPKEPIVKITMKTTPEDNNE